MRYVINIYIYIVNKKLNFYVVSDRLGSYVYYVNK